MNFIEIDNKMINLDKIATVERKMSKYDPNNIFSTSITLDDGSFISVDKEYYDKIKVLIKPAAL